MALLREVRAIDGRVSTVDCWVISGPLDFGTSRTGPVVSLVAEILKERRRNGSRHVLMQDDWAMRSILLLDRLAAVSGSGRRAREKQHMMCSLASFAFDGRAAPCLWQDRTTHSEAAVGNKLR